MNTDHSAPVTEGDLHAFVDGALSAERTIEVAAYLQTNPEGAQRVENWRAQAGALAAVLEPYRFGDEADLPPVRDQARMPRWAAIAASLLVAFGLGGGVGYLARGALADPAAPAGDSVSLEQAARDVFLTYVREVRHPVEVGAEERDHLTTWLGNRIERPFTAPSLAELGFSLVGGRLLPINGQPGAMLMYENANGDRATILLARNGNAHDTAFQYSRADGVNTFRWIDGPLAYAISGFLDRGALEDISRAVYDHFETG